MTVLPIVARELRVASRKRSTYWLRSGAALWIIVLGTWFFLILRNQAQQEVAMALFLVLTGSATLFCLFSGVRFTSDCLSEEKREGTLGLLFLTDLRGYDIVLGKLFASSLNTLYGVLAVVPMLAVPLMLGGITLGEFGRMAMVALNTLFFSLSVGICVSAGSRVPRSSAGMTLAIILVLSALLPAIGGYLKSNGKIVFFEPFLVFSPGTSFALAPETTYRGAPKLFWAALAVVHITGWLALAAASLIAPHAWQDRGQSGLLQRWTALWHSWTYGKAADRAAFRAQLLDINPFFWLSARARFKPALAWLAVGLIGLFWAWAYFKWRRDWLGVGTYLTTGIVLNLLFKGWFAAEAGRQLAEERHQGTLELLLTTPLSLTDILKGQFLTLVRQFLGPVSVVLCVHAVFMFAPAADELQPNERPLWVMVWLGAFILSLVGDLVALFWVGAWQAMSAKHPNRVATQAIALVLVVPSVAMGLVLAGISLITFTGNYEPSGKLLLAIWVGIGLGCDALFATWARRRLHTRFRAAAAQKYEPQVGWFRRFIGSTTKV
jgi:ABC-type transport system involved in multi-copper enzyme maturation permease subunit